MHILRSRRITSFVVALSSLLSLASLAHAATGRIRGKVTNAENAEPVSLAAVQLLPSDPAQRKTGAMTNSDGTYAIVAEEGTYTVRVLAQGFGAKEIAGVVITANGVHEVNVVLGVRAIQQQEVVVKADAKKNSESALLTARKKAATVGDAVSAEQIARNPDGDAAASLKRVTGLTTQKDGHVFVRGMGERYSSTQIDGVRVASPEANKRVVPLDILPAALVDHVVVQKTYSADRPGEFGGGDVQVTTKDFPGREIASFSLTQGWDEGTTLRAFRSYDGSTTDWYGFGVRARDVPDVISELAGGKKVVRRGLDPILGFVPDSLAMIGKSFRNLWTPSVTTTAVPSGGFTQSYGNEYTLFGRSLGVVESFSWSRSNDSRDEMQRFFTSRGDSVYNYAVTKWSETARVGGMSAVNYRLGREHTLHMRGLYSRTGEDEVRTYEGYNFGSSRSIRSTRLMYVARTIANGSVEGKHELASWSRPRIEWQVYASTALRDEPDRRETIYEGRDDNTWTLSGAGLGATRYFGHLTDDGTGAHATITFPLDAAVRSKVLVGGAFDGKERLSTYRRFNFNPGRAPDPTALPESIFAPERFTGRAGGAEIVEGTRPDDNYRAHQEVTSAFVSADLAVHRSVRAVIGARMEHAQQNVTTYDIFGFDPPIYGVLDNVDVLPTANITVSLDEKSNLRIAAARTLSRPDLRELTPGPTLEFVNGLRVAGNPNLRRASVSNYDVRMERFPAAGEVIAVGAFYKRFVDPIEQVLEPGDAPYLRPSNSEGGRNTGAEIEVRMSLRRLVPALERLFLNGNASLLSSRVTLEDRTTNLGTLVHPLQGQAAHVYNVSLAYTNASGSLHANVLVNAIGRRLSSLGIAPRPDSYDEPLTTLDVAATWSLVRGPRWKLTAKNLLDQATRTTQGAQETVRYHTGRSITLGVSVGR